MLDGVDHRRVDGLAINYLCRLKGCVEINGRSIVLSQNPSDRIENQSDLEYAMGSVSDSINVRFCEGYFALDHVPPMVNRNCSIKGEDIKGTEVNVSSNSVDSISFVADSLAYNITVKDLTMTKAGGVSAQSALRIQKSVESNGAPFPGPRIENVSFKGADGNAWPVVMSFKDAWLFHVRDVHATGSDTTRYGQFLRLDGASTDGKVEACEVSLVEHSIYMVAGGFSEGIVAKHNKFIGVDYGIYSPNGGNAPGGHFSENHVAAFRRAIQIEARPQWHISDNLLYRSDGADNDFVGISIGAASNDSIISGNRLIGFGSAGASVGIQSVAAGVDTSWNRVFNFGTGIDYVDTGTGQVDRNSFSGVTTAMAGMSLANLGSNPVII